jgi:hypothetical protein
MPHLYRQASRQNISQIQALARRIWQEAYSEMLSEAQICYMLERMYSEDAIIKELLSGVVWDIIEDDGKPCNYLSYTFGNLGSGLIL